MMMLLCVSFCILGTALLLVSQKLRILFPSSNIEENKYLRPKVKASLRPRPEGPRSEIHEI